MQNQPKTAGKLTSLFTLMILFGCMLPFVVICLGALFTQ